MKVLFLTPYPVEAASTRYRVYQYLPYLRQQGVEAMVRPFVRSGKHYRYHYLHGHWVLKTLLTLRSGISRLSDLMRAGGYDLVFIQREAFPFGPAWLEKWIAGKGTPVVFDFDDAIYMMHFSKANRRLAWLKQPEKTGAIIRLSAQTIAGNEELRRYAHRFNPNSLVIPTPIDTDVYHPHPPRSSEETITIGWIGGHTTLDYLHDLDEVFMQLAQKYRFRLRVVGGDYDVPGVDVSSSSWKLESELADLSSFDIGVMPMPDNPWTRGKCGFKALQYMGVGAATVASPVGVNREIIQHGVNGFLAQTAEDWLTCLSRLIEDPKLRHAMGREGRKTVEARYSVRLQAPRLLEILHRVAHG